MGDQTTVVIQQYLNELAIVDDESDAGPLIRDLVGRSVQRLEALCRNMLVKSYPRLMQPPLSLQVEDTLNAVVERLLKAIRSSRPATVRQFFAMANQHIRWELNELARQLDKRPPHQEFQEDLVPASAVSDSQLSAAAIRILQAIDSLPEEEREAFSLVRIQGMQQTEAAQILEVTPKTVQRRINRALVLLAKTLADFGVSEFPEGPE